MTTAQGQAVLSQRQPLSATRLDRYLVGPRLGSGAAASVYLARLEGPFQFERLLALKVVHEHLLAEKEFVQLFLDEANLAVRLSHPNIVHVYELGRSKGTLFMALEYLAGQTLASLYTRCEEQKAHVPYDVVAWIGSKAASALHYAHELKGDDGQTLGVVHRDVSPQNIFITYEGAVKLIDFGIARAKGRLVRTSLGKIRGKFRYMAPEQLLGGEFDHRVDLFSLGATLYEMAVGEPLFKGQDDTDVLEGVLSGEIPNPTQKILEFPGTLARILLRSLSAEPDERYNNGADLARDFDSYVTETGISDQQGRLASLLTTLFAQEQVAQAQAIADLRTAAIATPPLAEQRPTIPVERPDPTGPQSGVVSPPSNRRKGRIPPRFIWIIASLLALFLLAIALRSILRQNESFGEVQAPVITMDIVVQPSIPGTIRIDGQLVGNPPARVAMRQSWQPIDVSASAEGYDTTHMHVIPDRSQTVTLVLRNNRVTDPLASSVVATPLPSAQSASTASGKAPISEKPSPLTPPPTPLGSSKAVFAAPADSQALPKPTASLSAKAPEPSTPPSAEPKPPANTDIVTEYPF